MKPIIDISNISKTYRLGRVGATTLRDDLHRLWHKMRGKGAMGQGGVNNLGATAEVGDVVNALSDVSFSVQSGERVGIIGKNGAGKSTLLKILSRITSPSSGEITVRGRMASLLEVGTGFHPEFTGRENVYLNGTLLGMTQKEIDASFDKIVEFSGIGRYINTPVKRYSSGMRVRLGFAVAAHLNPEILVVDEVLAVGDAEFQSQALGKMQEVSSSQGRTVLFVSHNMNSIRHLCDRAIVLRQGAVVFDGEPDAAIDMYLNEGKKDNASSLTIESDLVSSMDVEIFDEDGKIVDSLINGERYTFVARLDLNSAVDDFDISLSFEDHFGNVIAVYPIRNIRKSVGVVDSGRYEISFSFINILNFGDYVLSFNIKKDGSWLCKAQKNVTVAEISSLAFKKTKGLIRMPFDHCCKKL